MDLIASGRLPARIDYLSQEVIFERRTEAQQIERNNLKNVAKMCKAAKFSNQFIVFMNELDMNST